MPTWKYVNLTEDNCGIDTSGHAVGRKRFAVEATDGWVSTAAMLTAVDPNTDIAVVQYKEVFSPDLPTATANNILTERKSGNQAVITVDFRSPDLIIFQPIENLLNQPAVITRADEVQQEEYLMDRHDPPYQVTNSAGEPFDHNPTRWGGPEIYTIQKYVTLSQLNRVLGLRQTINGGTIVIRGRAHAPNTLCLVKTQDEVVNTQSGSTIYRLTMEIHYNEDEWIDQIAMFGWSETWQFSNVSTHQTNTLRKDITQDDGSGNDVPIRRPWPLDDQGKKKADADDDPFVFEFQPYDIQDDWSAIPLA